MHIGSQGKEVLKIDRDCMIVYLMNKMDEMIRDGQTTTRYNITEELEKLGIDPDYSNKELMLQQLKELLLAS